MAVGFKVGTMYFSVGSEDFLHSFFSTIACFANYFVTNEGEDFIMVFEKALAASHQMSVDVFIQ